MAFDLALALFSIRTFSPKDVFNQVTLKNKKKLEI